ncbi:MAG: hypothetical protein E7668_02275 [Ruminococcaceae bacterium]|nr:hypothetical protein [Oscillospiraceae bacterium]
MKQLTIKLLAILMVILLIAGCVACSKKEDVGTDSDTDIADSQPIASVIPETETDEVTEETEKGPGKLIVRKLFDGQKGLKILGERTLSSEDYVYLDWPGSGIELAMECNGGKVVFRISGNGSVRVWLDGEPVKNAKGELIHATASGNLMLENVEAGEHVIKIVKVDGYSNRLQIPNVMFDGDLAQTAPADKRMYIEFVGDAAMGGTDVTETYPYLLAEAMDADYAITARDGFCFTSGDGLYNVGDWYGYASKGRDDTVTYKFPRTADAVVVDLGTTDAENQTSAERFGEEYAELLITIREKNPDCKIYCVYGSQTDTFNTQILTACQVLGGEEAGIYTLELTSTEHEANATAIKAKLAATADSPVGEIKRGGVGTVVDWSQGILQPKED